MAKRKPKPTAPPAPSPISAVPPTVFECSAAADIVTTTTETTGTTPGPHVFVPQLPPVTEGERQVAAKVLRKHLGLDPYAATATVAGLTDDQVRKVLGGQLCPDVQERLQELLGP